MEENKKEIDYNDPKFKIWYEKNEDKFLDEYIEKNKQMLTDYIMEHLIKDVILDYEELCTKFDIFVDTKWEST